MFKWFWTIFSLGAPIRNLRGRLVASLDEKWSFLFLASSYPRISSCMWCILSWCSHTRESDSRTWNHLQKLIVTRARFILVLLVNTWMYNVQMRKHFKLFKCFSYQILSVIYFSLNVVVYYFCLAYISTRFVPVKPDCVVFIVSKLPGGFYLYSASWVAVIYL